MRLLDVLLCQLYFARESSVTTILWLEPSIAVPSTPNVLGTPRDQQTTEEVADFLKSRFRPAPFAGKKPKEMRWVTTCITF